MYYTDPNAKHYSFLYKHKSYPSGTKLIFNGKCYVNESEVELNNQEVIWLYEQSSNSYFTDGIETYMHCRWTFTDKIVKIVPQVKLVDIEEEFFDWTDDMVTKTIWYAVIMVVGVLFKERLTIWLVATVIWVGSVFKKNK